MNLLATFMHVLYVQRNENRSIRINPRRTEEINCRNFSVVRETTPANPCLHLFVVILRVFLVIVAWLHVKFHVWQNVDSKLLAKNMTYKKDLFTMIITFGYKAAFRPAKRHNP